MSDAVRHLSDYDTEPRFRAVVVSSERLTPESSPDEIREIVLDVERPDEPYEPGQSIGVLAPPAPGLGQEHHFRLYSVAGLPERGPSGRPRLQIAVKRCSVLDEYSGERRPGVASNYLCDLKAGDVLTITGPYGLAWEVPEEHDATLVLIGSGTGIAPFRAFLKHLYGEVPDWTGRVLLFHGARSGLEMLYRNDERDDFAQYYDRETFEAIEALSPRPSWDGEIAWEETIWERGEELWELLGEPDTRVYVAGAESLLGKLDTVFAKVAGSREKWDRRKAELRAGERWVELVY